MMGTEPVSTGEITQSPVHLAAKDGRIVDDPTLGTETSVAQTGPMGVVVDAPEHSAATPGRDTAQTPQQEGFPSEEQREKDKQAFEAAIAKKREELTQHFGKDETKKDPDGKEITERVPNVNPVTSGEKIEPTLLDSTVNPGKNPSPQIAKRPTDSLSIQSESINAASPEKFSEHGYSAEALHEANYLAGETTPAAPQQAVTNESWWKKGLRKINPFKRRSNHVASNSNISGPTNADPLPQNNVAKPTNITPGK